MTSTFGPNFAPETLLIDPAHPAISILQQDLIQDLGVPEGAALGDAVFAALHTEEMWEEPELAHFDGLVPVVSFGYRGSETLFYRASTGGLVLYSIEPSEADWMNNRFIKIDTESLAELEHGFLKFHLEPETPSVLEPDASKRYTVAQAKALLDNLRALLASAHPAPVLQAAA